MLEYVPRRLGRERQCVCQVFDGDPFHAAAVPGIVRNAKQRAEQERIEELVAELPVARPDFAFPIRTEGKRIDKYRRGPAKLDIES